MKQPLNSEADTIVVGGGIAGLVTAYELLSAGQQVTVIERDTPGRLGGLCRWAFGGMALCSTAEQKRMGIADSAERLLSDWHSFAEFSEQDIWPKRWAKEYADTNYEKVYLWLKNTLKLKFLPAVNWVERGLYQPGNSVPRYHVLWGTGWQLAESLIAKLKPFVDQQQLSVYYQHKVTQVSFNGRQACGVEVMNEQTQQSFKLTAQNIVIACGGINGSLEKVREHWYQPWGKPPEKMLNGANPISDGLLHHRLEQQNVSVTHKDKMWNYAAGIRHPRPDFPQHGLSLIPCKSALWLDHQGQRIGPEPLVTGFDTRFLCQTVSQQDKHWTWQVLNYRIAKKELAVSGSLHNPSIRDQKLLRFLREILFGNTRLINELIEECPDVVVADNILDLVIKMNQLTDDDYISVEQLTQTIADFDWQLTQGQALENDDQLRRIRHARQWRADKLRTCQPKPIMSNGSGPLIAFKLQLISRKSLGGIQTNLQSQVLDQQGEVIKNLYAVGEAAGFGGGGANGLRSLEGTFLSGCILTARNAAQAINNNDK